MPRSSTRLRAAVLDPPRRARLSAERSAFDDERLKTLRRAVDRGGQAGWSAADHEQVDLLPGCELGADADRPQDLTG